MRDHSTTESLEMHTPVWRDVRLPGIVETTVRPVLERFNVSLKEATIGNKHFVKISDETPIPPALFTTLSRAIDGAKAWKISEGCIHLTKDFLVQEQATAALYAEDGVRGGLTNHALPERVDDSGVYIFDITLLHPFRSIHADPTHALVIALRDKETAIPFIQALYGGQWDEMSKDEFLRSFSFRD